MALLTPKYSYDNFKDTFTFGKGLMIADIVTTTYTKSGIPIRSATSGGMEGIKKILPLMYTSPNKNSFIIILNRTLFFSIG